MPRPLSQQKFDPNSPQQTGSEPVQATSELTAPLSSPRVSTSSFPARHIGPHAASIQEMLHTLGYASARDLADAALPDSIKNRELNLPPRRSEQDVLAALQAYADKNVQKKQLIGAGYYDTVTPAVIRRNIVENPGWYTAYTPYQPEISQGRLEALLNFQTAVGELTGFDVVNASLLDEATAVAEAIQLMVRGGRRSNGGDALVLLDSACHPQIIAVARSRAQAAGIALRVSTITSEVIAGADNLVGVVIAQPGTTGEVRDLAPLINSAKEKKALVTVDCDLLAQTLLTSPGELGADIAVGSAQRFGVPLFFGGPHAAFMAVTSALTRKMPGRIVGVSKDEEGTPAYRLTLQTREQHIRRDRATSNICTAQALLAVVAGMYAVWHGPEGLKEIAGRIHSQAAALADAIVVAGLQIVHDTFFDTIAVKHSTENAARIALARAREEGFNLRELGGRMVGISLGESTTNADIRQLAAILISAEGRDSGTGPDSMDDVRTLTAGLPGDHRTVAVRGTAHMPVAFLRQDEILTHPIFHAVTSETEMMRYMRMLADRDLALDRTMIPLGSCTMKLNSAVEMEPITWPGFASIHPLAPKEHTEGWRALIEDLEHTLADMTGYAAVSIQPNAGSQGEFAGLLAIRRFHQSRGDGQRTICLIPESAHGTNAASAALAGLTVIAVKSRDDGSIDLGDLDAKLDTLGDKVAGIMITYPSTHGVYEDDVRAVCDKVHAAGGQVYIDGVNLNALVGLAQPGQFGGDVSHLNLHKTFTIPHGGGGPGVGPICVAEHLVPFLPSDPMGSTAMGAGEASGSGGENGDLTGVPISGATYGSAGVVPISWAYIALMGGDGLAAASEMALVNANYISHQLADDFPTLYTGKNGLVAHECILDVRDLTKRSGITAEDVSKRLMDFGFHAPTLAFPVPGTLMVEPTESEDKGELDRFIEAMRTIRQEIDDVINGTVSEDDSVLRHAPYTAWSVTRDDFDDAVSHGHFTRAQAAFPVPGLRRTKYFPPVRRIDNAYGDRNVVCSCPPLEDFAITDDESISLTTPGPSV
ncbi:aminomethyl-transferring glycine dehydrogenase [Corynebacterium sp. PCR 32]|uniref:aminomethyl-transferring glycine dehydrogenase n=1 Tax=Corynebacterium sp. PCR 32 TaxID=3351342 RepID=UPI003750E363